MSLSIVCIGILEVFCYERDSGKLLAPECLSMNYFKGELLTAGEQLSVWECNDQQDWKKIWTQRQENNRNHT
jgi:hypothetical protein